MCEKMSGLFLKGLKPAAPPIIYSSSTPPNIEKLLDGARDKLKEAFEINPLFINDHTKC